jgi:hypothetical protein
LRRGRLVALAASDFIGLAHRWLNIAAIAPFREGKARQIAYVKTPHIGGTLHFVELRNDDLVQVGQMPGFSNHAIGSRELRLSANADIDGDGRPELALPTGDRRALRIVRFREGRLTALAVVPLPAPIDKAIGVKGRPGAIRFIVGLADGRVFVVGKRAAR